MQPQISNRTNHEIQPSGSSLFCTPSTSIADRITIRRTHSFSETEGQSAETTSEINLQPSNPGIPKRLHRNQNAFNDKVYLLLYMYIIILVTIYALTDIPLM